jgi:pyrroline-5-carboxylate reductase
LKKDFGFVGGGAMAEAILRGMLQARWQPGDIMVSEPVETRRAYLKEAYGIETTQDNSEIASQCETLILAVKPQHFEAAARDLNRNDILYERAYSIIAGVSIARLEAALPKRTRVVRVMPNTPALIGAATSVLSIGSQAGQEDLNLARAVFEAVGGVYILSESMMDAVTGLSGSGPAYVYLLIEAMADGGVMAGLPRDMAYKLAAETVVGSAKMVLESGLHPGALKDRVCSPAGTTIEAVYRLEKNGFRGALMEAVWAASEKSKCM